MAYVQNVQYICLSAYSLPDVLLPTEHASKKAEAEQRRKAEANAKAAAKEAHRQRIVNVTHHYTLQTTDTE